MFDAFTNCYILYLWTFLVVLQMAPKGTSGSKRKNPPSSSSRQNQPPVPRTFDPHRFRSKETYARFLALEKRTTWHDKVFAINPTGKWTHILEIFVSRKWEKLLNPHTNIHLDIVREFYANALPAGSEPDKTFSYTTYVRGKTIRFDRDAIDEYLGNAFTFPEPEDPDEEQYCAYTKKNAKGNWDHSKIQKDILIRGKRYGKSAAGKDHKASYCDMNVAASVIFKFLVHNVWPKSHVSSAPLKVTPLIWYILTGGEVDIARIIAREIKHVALSGVTEPATKIAFPGFIMGLVLAQKVHLTGPPQEVLTHPIDDDFIRNLARKEAKELRAASSSHPEPETAPPHAPTHANAFDFTPWLYQINQYSWDQNEALYRSNTAVHQSVYNAQMHPGDPAYPVMTPEEYHAFVSWPGGRPGPYGGGEASHAAEDGDQDAADDGDEEDSATDEEEQDSDDAMED